MRIAAGILGFLVAQAACAQLDYRVEIDAPREMAQTLRQGLNLTRWQGDPQMTAEQLRRLADEAVREARERGIAELSLNFAAFGRLFDRPQNVLDRLLARLIAFTNPFFQIESLYRFNAKFSPRWEPRYLVYEGRLGLPRAGLAALRAEGQLPRLRIR